MSSTQSTSSNPSLDSQSIDSFNNSWGQLVTSLRIDPANASDKQIEQLTGVARAVIASNTSLGDYSLSKAFKPIDKTTLLSKLGVDPAQVSSDWINKFKEVDQKASQLMKNVTSEKQFQKILLDPKIHIQLLPKDFFVPINPPLLGGNGGVGGGSVWGLFSIIIPEDSIYRKILACVPIIGIVSTVINEGSLRKKITQSIVPDNVVKLITAKNHYKFASIVRKILTVALIVAIVGQNILFASAALGAGFISYYAYSAYKNKQLITSVQANGIPASGLDLR